MHTKRIYSHTQWQNCLQAPKLLGQFSAAIHLQQTPLHHPLPINSAWRHLSEIWCYSTTDLHGCMWHTWTLWKTSVRHVTAAHQLAERKPAVGLRSTLASTWSCRSTDTRGRHWQQALQRSPAWLEGGTRPEYRMLQRTKNAHACGIKHCRSVNVSYIYDLITKFPVHS